MSTEQFLTLVSSISSGTCVVLFLIFKNGAQKYVDKKAENLATEEDVARITSEVEGVKSDFGNRTHAWKQIFESEYALMKEVWATTWEFQALARSLRPLMDYLPEDREKEREQLIERYNRYQKGVVAFRDVVIKNQPFIPPNIYDKSLELRETVLELEVHFEINLRHNVEIDWRKILDAAKKLDEGLEELNNSIREHFYSKAE